jgi:hypothetical protein
MKKFLVMLAACLTMGTATAQLVGIEVEEFLVHPATPYPDGVNLNGYTTFRIYAVMTNTDDFCSAVFGFGSDATQINSTTGFWQSAFGGLTADNLNPGFFPFIPSMQYDSFVTIGKLHAGDPGPQIFVAEDANDPWIAPFNAGGNIVMDGPIGGSWFIPNLGPGPTQSPNGYAGADLKVLIGQFTTTGTLSGCINIQSFVHGISSNVVEGEYCFGGVFGCTDTSACNFDPAAELDDGSCVSDCVLEWANITVTPPTCSNSTNGSIVVSTTGGQGVLSYAIDDDFQVLGILLMVHTTSTLKIKPENVRSQAFAPWIR